MNNKIQFRNKQLSIYNEIRTNMSELCEFVPHNTAGESSYIISLRYSEEITDMLEKMNREISSIIPNLAYDRSNIHTTVATLKSTVSSEDTLKRIADLLSDIEILPMEICFDDILVDQSAIIMASEYNNDFYNSSTRIISMLRRNGLAFKLPWGSHITVCRFLENGMSEQVQKIKDVVGKYKKRFSTRPKSIDVGFCRSYVDRFELDVYQSRRL